VKKIISIVLAAALVILFLIYQLIARPKLEILNGYAAKKACSCFHLSERNLTSIEDHDLATSPLNLAQLSIDNTELTVSSSVFGLAKRTACYMPGLGCILQNNKPINLEAPSKTKKKADSLSWPRGGLKAAFKTYGINQAHIDKAMELAFDKEGEFVKKTRAFLIIQNDSFIAERYAPGYDKDTELLGWSMTKSICNILLGILAKEGKVDVQSNKLFEEWDDERQEIRLDHLLRMSSGLEWREVYSEKSDATLMLFKSDNMPQYVLNRKLESEPGSYFEYSSGTTNLLSLLIRRTFEDYNQYLDFPYKELFNKLGMESIFLESDASGNYVLSSYCYATPRDWAKLGLLYLHKGKWNDEEIFTESWYNYSIKPTKVSWNASYGAHIWLNTNNNDLKDAPDSVFRFSGYEGQYVYMIPSHNAVVVRMGLSEGPEFDMNAVMKEVLAGLD